MNEKRVRKCSHCKQEHQHRRRYCSTECKRAAMRANRVTYSGTCRTCGNCFTRETSASGSKPEMCSPCLRARSAAAQKAWREQGPQEQNTPDEQLAGELERSRLRLSCELAHLRGRVMALAADLGL